MYKGSDVTLNWKMFLCKKYPRNEQPLCLFSAKFTPWAFFSGIWKRRFGWFSQVPVKSMDDEGMLVEVVRISLSYREF